MVSCPWIKFVFCNSKGKQIRVGPRITVEHYIEHNGVELQVFGFSVRGRGREILAYELSVDLSEYDNQMTIHQIVGDSFQEVNPTIDLGISS